MREKIKKLTPGWVKKLYQGARYAGITALFCVAWLVPIDKRLVVLCNVWGYGDNSRYVAQELLRRMQTKKKVYRLVFVTNHPEQVPQEEAMKAYRTNSLRAIFALARAGIWVECNRKEPYIRKRRGQYYIQMWHGGLALKKVEGDCAQVLGEKYIRRAKRDSANTDLFVSNAKACTRMYRRAFWAKAEIAEWGSPRNDIFVQIAEEKKQKPAAGTQTKTKHIAVFAPTYRSTAANYLDFSAEVLLEALRERFGGEWELYVRLHPLVAAGTDFSGVEGVKDISAQGDLYEYLYEAEVLITDYSNTLFEFALTGRPVFLYAPDAQQYERERGLYFDFETLPFPKAHTEKELAACVREYREEEFLPAQKKLFASVGLMESGRASSYVADRIEERIMRSLHS